MSFISDFKYDIFQDYYRLHIHDLTYGFTYIRRYTRAVSNKPYSIIIIIIITITIIIH